MSLTRTDFADVASLGIPRPASRSALAVSVGVGIGLAASISGPPQGQKRCAPGRVIEWDEDNEPTGLRYDVTLLHGDGSTTDVLVDTVTGRVTSIQHDDNRD